MTPENLELLARKAILEKRAYPFFKLSPPVVQIWCERELTDFSIPYIYLGQRFCRTEGLNGYIYNLCAYQILQHLERFKEEFDLK